MSEARERLRALLPRENQLYVDLHPRSGEMAKRTNRNMLWGVPSVWMKYWPGPYPIYIDEADGAHVRDVDGVDYVDLALGDTAAIAGHRPPAVVAGLDDLLRRGLTTMMVSEDAEWVGQELERRFGLRYWQLTVSATDANRFSLRLARALTGRSKVLIFNTAYHGTVDETMATVDQTGQVVARPNNVGPGYPLSLTTKMVEYNDLDAVERALADEDVALVLVEPILTSVGVVEPIPGWNEGLWDLTRRYGTLLSLDETHTLCVGPGGVKKERGLQSDIVSCGKAIAAGFPVGVFGLSEELGERVMDWYANRVDQVRSDDDGAFRYLDGIGGTLAGSPLALAAIKINLESVLTDEVYERTVPLGKRFCDGVRGALTRFDVPWHVSQLGASGELSYRPDPPRNAAEGAAGYDEEFDDFLRLYELNRGVLTTPMRMIHALIAPETTAADIDLHSEVFGAALEELFG